jgi:hypothetical protein
MTKSPFLFTNVKRANIWIKREGLYKLCTNGEISDVRLVGDVDVSLFDLALDECSTSDCLSSKDQGAGGVHESVSFGLGLGSAIFSGLAMTTGPVLGGLGSIWSLVGGGAPSWDETMDEVDNRIQAAQTEMSLTIISSEIQTVGLHLQRTRKNYPSNPYDTEENPRCSKPDDLHLIRGSIVQMLTNTINHVTNFDMEVLALEEIVKTLPLLADLTYVGYTYTLGVVTKQDCGAIYSNFRGDWQRLLYLVDLVEKKYKAAKVCPAQGRSLTLREDKPKNCDVNQWKCYYKTKGFINVVYCGDDGTHGSTHGTGTSCPKGKSCYSPNGVHFRGNTASKAYDSKWPQIAHVRNAFLDNQALLLDPIKEYIARLQTDVDQLCGYCSVRDSMIEPDRAIPVEIFLVASSQNHCAGSQLTACVSTLKRTYNRPTQPQKLRDDKFDFCGPTSTTLKKELEHQKKKNLVYAPPTCEALTPAKLTRKAEIPPLNRGDRLQPWSIFLLSIACLLWVVE